LPHIYGAGDLKTQAYKLRYSIGLMHKEHEWMDLSHSAI